MKGKKIALGILATACTMGGAVALFGCNNGHTHDYATEFTAIVSSDGTSEYHTHKCKDETCNVTSGSEKHDWAVAETAATCTTAKTVVYTCKVCNYSKTETEGEALGHVWGDWEITTEDTPTADKDGKATRKCTVDGCNTVDTADITVPRILIDGAINSVYDNWVTYNTADCENEGTATYTYVNAEYNVTLSFSGKSPALGHNWKETFDVDDDNHYITCTRNAEHIKPDSTQAHIKQTSETPSLIYNKQSGKWEHVYHITCKAECGYKKDFKGTEADLNDGGNGVSLSDVTVGSGTFDSPFVISASNTRVNTITIPANTVVSLRYKNINAMERYAVVSTESDNLSVIYGERVEVVEAGERAKSDPYIGERGDSLDFAFTTTNREAATITFKFFDNDHYYIAGNPANVVVDTEYTDEVPLETDVVHTFVPTVDGMYTFTVTGGEIMLENGYDLISAGSSFTEPLYYGNSYKITVYKDLNRNAGTVKFEIERAGDIPEPAEGSLSRPQAIAETGEYEINGSRFFAFTPAQSGFYVFCDVNSADAEYSLNSDSSFVNQLTGSIYFANKKSYSYIEYELNAGITYYLYAAAGNGGTINMTISRHEHEFDTAHWQSDVNSHWHVSTCEHNIKDSMSGHTYNDSDICTTCGWEKVEEVVTQGLLFELSDDGTYYIVSAGTIPADIEEVYIPSYYGEEGSKLPVKEIKASGFESKAFITSISIPASITKIGSNAFKSCTSITSVYITDLNAWASIDFGNNFANPFYAGFNSESVCSPETAIYVNGTPLVNVELSVSVSKYAFVNCGSIQTVKLSGETVGTYAFAYSVGLQSVTLNEGVETLANNAFYCCGSLNKLVVSTTLSTVGSNAFGMQAGGRGKTEIPGAQINEVYFLGTSAADLKQEDGETDKAWIATLGKTVYLYSVDTPATEGNFWHYVAGVPTAY